MQRRHFLHSIAAVAALTTAGRLYALSDSPARFLLVFLRGGYDCANVLIPYSSDDYYEVRPTIAIAKPSPTDPDSAIELNTDWALSPALRESILPLYRRGEIAFVPFAGTDDLSRSHFKTQDSIERGEPLQERPNLRSGFMARLAEQLPSARPIAFTNSLPLAFRGTSDIPNVSLRAVNRPVFDEREAQILSSMYAGHRLQPAIDGGLELREQVGRAIQEEMTAANRDSITPHGFELEAQRVALLMRDRYQLGFIDVGGWDMHVNEGAANGRLANNLRSLGRGLQLLAQGLGDEWQNTVVVVVSEFGRTFSENGNRGTDHGHGSTYWILGGGIRGGRIVGEQQRVSLGALFEERDFPVLNDYRAVLGGLFARLWGLSGEQLERVFPQGARVDLGLI